VHHLVQMYRSHLKEMLHYQYPDHYSIVLKLLLRGLYARSLATLCFLYMSRSPVIVSCVSLFVKWCEFGLCVVSVSLAKVGDFKTEKPTRNLINAEHKVTLNPSETKNLRLRLLLRPKFGLRIIYSCQSDLKPNDCFASIEIGIHYY